MDIVERQIVSTITHQKLNALVNYYGLSRRVDLPWNEEARILDFTGIECERARKLRLAYARWKEITDQLVERSR